MRKHRLHSLFASSVFALAIGVGCGSESPDAADGTSQAPLLATDAKGRIEGSYIVVYKDIGDATATATTDKHEKVHGAKISHRYGHALHGYSGKLSTAALAAVRSDPNVAYVEADQTAYAIGVESNPPSWGLDRVDQRSLPLDGLYTYDNDASNVEAYVVDTGIRFDHQEFGGRAVSGYDFVDSDTNASDCYGHGTHVAGTIGGTTTGIAKQVKLVSVRVLGCDGRGSWSNVIAGIDYVTDQKTARPAVPMVGNMSLGGGLSFAVNDAVNSSSDAGVVWAVAAGNNNADACSTSPASASRALTVGATTSTDARASFSNYGSCLDLFAPGQNIVSSTMTGTNTYESWSGTSMATPHVAGAAALYLSIHPGATSSTAMSAIVANATSGKVTSAGTSSPNKLLDSRLNADPPPAAVNVHVADLDGSAARTYNRRWRATIIIRVADAANAAISGAIVSGTFSSGGSASCTTSSSGTCSVTANNISRSYASTTFTVTNVTGSNMSYVPASNSDPDGDSTGTAITITQP